MNPKETKLMDAVKPRIRLEAKSLRSETGCILWQGYLLNGYGQLKLNGRYEYVHRVAWAVKYGSVPEGMCVLHRCDVRNCINTEHLFLGTKADNNADKSRKGRAPATNPMLGKHFSEKSKRQMSMSRWRNFHNGAMWAYGAVVGTSLGTLVKLEEPAPSLARWGL